MSTRISSAIAFCMAVSNFAIVDHCMAQAGDLDLSFGNGGKVVTDFPFDVEIDVDLPTRSAALPDGGMVVVGKAFAGSGFRSIWLARLNPDGSQDLAFGDGGEVHLPIDDGTLQTVHAGPDGSIMVGGHVRAGNAQGTSNDWLLARFKSDGSPDLGFGQSGVVTIDVGDTPGQVESRLSEDTLDEVFLLADGRILAVGLTSSSLGDHIALMVFRPDGKVDTSFGQSGRILLALDAFGTLAPPTLGGRFALRAARQSDGRILIASQAKTTFANDTLYLIRLSPDGTPDLTFGVGGVAKYVKTSTPGPDLAAIAVRPDGGVFVLASLHIDGWNNNPTLLALNSDGSFDLGFGASGLATIDLGMYSEDPPSFELLGIASDGTPVLGGTRVSYEVSSGSNIVKLYYNDMAAMKLNTDGSVDSGFGTDGLAAVSIYEYHREMYANSLTILDDDSIVLSGPIRHFPDGIYEFQSKHIATVRLDASGMLDTGYGVSGTAFVVSHRSGGNNARDLVVTQGDGRIVVAGVARTHNTLFDVALARYDPDGSLDASFGDQGRVTTDLQSINEDWAIEGGSWARSNDLANAVITQPDGKLVVAGESFVAYPYFPRDSVFPSFALARYNGDGSLDSEFGTDGIVLTSFVSDVGREGHGSATDVALQDDGKLVAVGHANNRPGGGPYEIEFVIARYHPDGTLDTEFGNQGRVRVNRLSRHDEYARSVDIQPDGKIVIAGYYKHHQFWRDSDGIEIVRLNPDGSLDTGFGEGGIVLQDIGAGSGWNEHSDDIFEVELLPDGGILAGGSALINGSYDMLLAKYLPDGSPDTSFGFNGIASLDFSDGLPGERRGADEIYSIEVQSDGRIVVAGYTGRLIENPVPREKHLYRYVVSYEFALARFEADGVLDYSFGYGGRVTTSFISPANAAYSISIQADGKIVAAGETRYIDSSGFTSLAYADIAIARYEGINSRLDEIEALVFHTQDLVSTGPLNEGQANSLQVKLQAAAQQVDRGNFNAAVKQLTAFETEVLVLRSHGDIPDSSATFLLSEVRILIEALSI